MTVMDPLRRSQSDMNISVSRAPSGPRSARPKKKGALSKLAERKSRDLAAAAAAAEVVVGGGGGGNTVGSKEGPVASTSSSGTSVDRARPTPPHRHYPQPHSHHLPLTSSPIPMEPLVVCVNSSDSRLGETDRDALHSGSSLTATASTRSLTATASTRSLTATASTRSFVSTRDSSSDSYHLSDLSNSVVLPGLDSAVPSSEDFRPLDPGPGRSASRVTDPSPRRSDRTSNLSPACSTDSPASSDPRSATSLSEVFRRKSDSSLLPHHLSRKSSPLPTAEHRHLGHSSSATATTTAPTVAASPHPFRQLKVASEDSTSMVGARTSPFKPKPPVTPRKSKSLTCFRSENNRTATTTAITTSNSATATTNNNDRHDGDDGSGVGSSGAESLLSAEVAVSKPGLLRRRHVSQQQQQQQHGLPRDNNKQQQQQQLFEQRGGEGGLENKGENCKLPAVMSGNMDSTDTTIATIGSSSDTAESASTLTSVSRAGPLVVSHKRPASLTPLTPLSTDLLQQHQLQLLPAHHRHAGAPVSGSGWLNDLDSSECSSISCRVLESPPGSVANSNFRRLSPISSPPPIPPFMGYGTLRGHFKSEPMVNISHSLLSNASTTSALPAITIEKARSRSFLFGNINSGIPLLGSEELERYFPNRKVRLFIGSWNMGEFKDIINPHLEDFILPESCELVQDIYVIGTQENALNKRQWEITLQETLGPSYVLFHSASLGSLHLAIFMRRDLIWFCSTPEEDSLTTRAVTMIKTKGSVAVAMTFFGTSMLFIISHFTAYYQKIADRMSEYEKTIRDLRLPKGTHLSGSKDVTSRYDAVFWMGDFNFRINGAKCPVETLVKDDSRVRPNFEKILQSDQLMELLNEGKIFKGFQEGRISFQPTYKFDVKSDSDYHKHRTPSYTDRILFRSRHKNCIVCTDYDSVMNVNLSDHKPVFAVFEVSIRPGRDTLALAAGKFNREVYMEANRRRAAKQFAPASPRKASSVCAIQ
ncbi:72 kDa inositol polyphosphate 5-phosphatase-like [Argonauta hians]